MLSALMKPNFCSSKSINFASLPIAMSLFPLSYQRFFVPLIVECSCKKLSSKLINARLEQTKKHTNHLGYQLVCKEIIGD